MASARASLELVGGAHARRWSEPARAAAQLAAGGVDVVAAGRCGCRRHVGRAQALLERADALGRRALRTAGPLNGFQGMRFTLAGMPRSRRGRRSASASLSLTPGEQHVLERDAAAVRQREAPRGVQQRRDRPLLLIGMIASRTSSVVAFSEIARLGAGLQRAQLLDGRDQARRRHRDPPRREARAPRVLEQRQRARDVVEVVQRLAHPHEHEVGGPAARERGRAVDLLDDLAGAEVAPEARASRSRRTAQSIAQPTCDEMHSVSLSRGVLVGDQHRLDGAAVVRAERAACACRRGPSGRTSCASGVSGWSRSSAARSARRDVGHRVERRRALAVQPAEDLLGAVLGRARRRHPGGQLVGQQRAQIALRGGLEGGQGGRRRSRREGYITLRRPRAGAAV